MRTPVPAKWLRLSMIAVVVVVMFLPSQTKNEWTLTALPMALSRRVAQAGLVHHSDRGSQYASSDYTDLLKKPTASTSACRISTQSGSRGQDRDTESALSSSRSRAESEIAGFRKLQALMCKLVDVNRKICRLRPVEQIEQTTHEKKRPTQYNKKLPAK